MLYSLSLHVGWLHSSPCSLTGGPPWGGDWAVTVWGGHPCCQKGLPCNCCSWGVCLVVCVASARDTLLSLTIPLTYLGWVLRLRTYQYTWILLAKGKVLVFSFTNRTKGASNHLYIVVYNSVSKVIITWFYDSYCINVIRVSRISALPDTVRVVQQTGYYLLALSPLTCWNRRMRCHLNHLIGSCGFGTADSARTNTLL